MSYKKYYVYKKQYSTDGGTTWTDIVPQETMPKGNPIEIYDTLEECEGEPPSHEERYLTLRANTTAGSVKLNNAPSTFYYSTNSGSTWNSATSATTIPMSTGGTLFKGELTPYIGTFSASTQFTAEGNIMSLLFGNNFSGQTSLSGKDNAFKGLFRGCKELTNAENLVLPATELSPYCYAAMFRGCTRLTTIPQLPATTLTDNCYNEMFSGCTSLTEAPVLPATTLGYICYGSMFNGCTSLTTAPELPATTLSPYCYLSMFSGCTSLTTAPTLSATTLAERCYGFMFEGCTSLTTAPELPSTTLANDCYCGMFWGCTSLTTAPELPATTLTHYCYGSMFWGCTNLNYIKCLATDISASICLTSWVKDVPSSGTFVKDASMNDWPTGDNGIPYGWTVVEI